MNVVITEAGSSATGGSGSAVYISKLDTAAGGMPVLRYQTVATRFPAGVSRFEDSLAKGPLKKDLRTEQDPACSYTRLFRFSDGVFHPDQALPDCAGYTEP